MMKTIFTNHHNQLKPSLFMFKNSTTKIFILTFIAISAFFATSCQIGPKQGKPKLLFNIQKPSFSYKVEESGLRLDADNKVQCKHYFNYESDPKNGYEINAGQLEAVVSILLDVDKLNVAIETDSTENKFFNIDYKGEITKENNREILGKLLGYYSIKLNKDRAKVNASELYIKDNEKLKPYISEANTNSGSSVEYEQNKITIENASLKMLASQLKNIYGQRFSYNENDTARYNLEIGLKDSWEETTAFFEEHYGLSFKDIQQEITAYRVIDKT